MVILSRYGRLGLNCTAHVHHTWVCQKMGPIVSDLSCHFVTACSARNLIGHQCQWKRSGGS
jgi:hypothetical protein